MTLVRPLLHAPLIRLTPLLAALVACLPQPEAPECRGADECPPGGQCMDGRCSGGVTLPDLGDGATTDAADPTSPESCAEAELIATNAGCRFWAVDLPTSWEPSEPYGLVIPSEQPFAVVVTNATRTEDANVAVYLRRDAEALATATLKPGEVHTFVLPQQNIDATVNGPSKAYRIESDRPIAAYQFQPLDNPGSLYTGDASALFPEHVLTDDYIAVSGHAIWLKMFPDGFEPEVYNAGAFLTIVGTAANTQVKLYPKTGTLTPTASAITLGRGDAFTIFSDLEKSVGPMPGDLSGTRIVADKPIAVFGGSVSATMPAYTGGCCADHLEHQLLPLSAWGSRYVAAPPPSASAPDRPAPAVYRLTGAFNSTTLEWPAGRPDGAPTTIHGGETAIFMTDEPVVVRGSDPDKPFALTQFLVSSENADPSGSGLGDPAMTVVPAIDQMQPSYSFLVPLGYEGNYATIVAPVGAQILLDQVAIEPSSPVGRIDDVDYVHGAFAVAPGPHELRATAPVSLSVVGYDEYVSYAYPGGCGLQALSNLPPVP